jgi:hypothetical protein
MQHMMRWLQVIMVHFWWLKTFHKISFNGAKMVVYYGVIGQVEDYMILMN